MRKVTMESKWPWNEKPRVTPLLYKCTSLYNGKWESLTLILHCVLSLLCVCVHLSHTPCVCLTWCLTWYQSGRLLALLHIEWAICVYGLCISAKILDIFASLRVFVALILQHSEILSWRRAAFKICGSTQKLVLKKSNTAHLKVDFFLQFLSIKFCILESCWKNCLKLIPEEVMSFLVKNISEYF